MTFKQKSPNHNDKSVVAFNNNGKDKHVFSELNGRIFLWIYVIALESLNYNPSSDG